MKRLIIFLALLVCSSAQASTQVVLGGAEGDVPSGATRYTILQGGNDLYSTESDGLHPVTMTGTFQNLRVVTEDPPGTGESITFTLRAGANDASMSDTSMTVTVSGASDRTGSDTSNTYDVTVAGTLVSMEMVTTGGYSGGEVGWAIEFVPDTAGQTFQMGGTKGAASTRYAAFSGVDDAVEVDEDRVTAMMPSTGSCTAMYCYMPTAPGSGTSITTTVRNSTDSTDSDISCAISDTNKTCNDTGTLTMSVTGTMVNYKMAVSGAITGNDVHCSTVIEPTDDDDFFILMQTIDNPSNDEFTYLTAGHDKAFWTSTSFGERFVGMSGLGSSGTITDVRYSISVAPGSGLSRTYTAETYAPGGPTSTGLTITYSDSESGVKTQTSLSENVSDNSAIRWKHTDVGTPASTRTKISILANIPSAAPAARRRLLIFN